MTTYAPTLGDTGETEEIEVLPEVEPMTTPEPSPVVPAEPEPVGA